MTFRHLRFRPV